jgi:hypothetical protein
MQSKLKNRIKSLEPKRNMAIQILDKSGYMILSFVALWASARFTEWSIQFIALAVILGLKWVFTDQKQIIQIFSKERG